MDEITVGAVAYHPRVLSIWEDFRDHFQREGVPLDYVLFSSYERLVEAVLDGAVEIGWNTNTAFVALERALGAQARILGMRDVDASFATVIAMRRGEGVAEPAELAGRRLALGSRDSGHACILPLHYLAREGLAARERCELVRFDRDLGKHGDTGGSEREVLRAVAEGRADAGAVGEPTWARFRSEGLPELGELELVWRSPTFYHCNFSALPSLADERAEGFRRALLAMSYEDPRMRPAMSLEGVRRWLPGERSGYESLIAAMAESGSAAP
jgi:ABC-type phosphate/phosphonate transport system substrate-binding protein